MDHARGAAIFHGAPVRMWQAGSQLEAPVIEVDRAAQRLIARGENGDGPAAASRVPRVRTLLMGANGATAGPAGPAPGTGRPCPVVGPGAGKQATTAQPEVLRIVSGAMVYSKTLGEAEFTGGLRVDAADQAGGTIRANSGIAYLDSPKEKTAAADVPVFAGKIDRIVAAGRVLVERPGLRATGERLVYTAAGQNFMLTGDAENPPRATDARGSTTTAAALEFHRGCNGAGDTVEALGSLPGGPAGQVHTESSVETRQTVPAR